MKNFQTKLDVIGNNIANVNTYGFKKGRVVFKDMISQSAGSASAPAGNRGGINPKQVGLGSQIASIDTIQTEGSSQSTNRVLDLAIAGDGYFVVGETGANAQHFFTRAGNFYLDNNGDLVTSDGLYVLDTAKGKINIPKDAKDVSISSDGTVKFLNAAGNIDGNQTIELAKFNNTGGLQKYGNNLFKDTTNSGIPLYDQRASLGTIQSNMLEMSNVDLSEEFTEMIVAQRGFQANTRIITTSDEILQELVNLKR